MDEDAEAVKQKHLEEVREEEEISEMALHDRPPPKAIAFQEEPEVVLVEPAAGGGIFDDVGEITTAHVPEPVVPLQATSSSSAAPSLPMDIPRTPDDGGGSAPVTPRQSPTTRTHEVEPDDHDAKRARLETAKKQGLDRISLDMKR